MSCYRVEPTSWVAVRQGNPVRRRLLGNTALAAVIVTVLAAGVGSAWADDSGAGGTGGNGYNASNGGGGTGGTGFNGEPGNNGGNGIYPSGPDGSGGGGGSAGGGVGGIGGNGQTSTGTNAYGQGGAGGNVGHPDGYTGTAGSGIANGGGGGGGGGGANGSNAAALPGASVSGGDGGTGGAGLGSGGGGGGGAGGFGAIVTGTVTTTAPVTNGAAVTIQGGTGGTGGASDISGPGVGVFGGAGGSGGAGGVGADFTNGTGFALINAGTIAGGAGGTGGAADVGGDGNTRNGGNGGNGGDAIVGANLSIINQGTITGGDAGAGGVGTPNGTAGAAGTAGNAITFTGGVNSLEIDSGTITGNVVAYSTDDTLLLGGSTGGTFDVSQIGSTAQYRGFGQFAEDATSGTVWTLTGTPGQTSTPWTITSGTLNVAADATLGTAASSGVTLNGGTFQFGAAFTTDAARTFTLNAVDGNTIDTNGYSDTIAGVVGGTGGFTKVGAGTLTLSGTNIYTGTTTINDGTVSVSADANLGDTTANAGIVFTGDSTLETTTGITSARDITLDNATGTIQVDASQTTTLSGTISDTSAEVGGGAGALTKTGAGTLVLSGTNTYTGGTTIAAGILSVSADDNLGDSSGGLTFTGGTLETTADGFSSARAITLDTAGTVQVDTGTSTLSGVIADGTGAGTLTKTGAGTLVLTGDNTYTGTTTISAGILQVGDGDAVGSISSSANIVDTATLAIKLASAFVYDGVISGTAGTFEQDGTGTTTLTATNTYSGATTVNAGELDVTGSIAASSGVTVEADAVLGGTGTVSGVDVLAGGVLSPGTATAPVGSTLNTGAVTFETGSIYNVNITPTATNMVVATGTTTINGGTVNVNAVDGFYTTATRTILTATTVTGTFDDVTTNLAFLTPTLSYTATEVDLTLQQGDFRNGALTPNEFAVAGGLNAAGLLPANSRTAPLITALDQLTIDQAPAALNALSGEVHASAVSNAYQDADLPRGAVMDRLTSPYGSLAATGFSAYSASTTYVKPSIAPRASIWTFWGAGLGAEGRFGSNGNASALDRTAAGFILGADASPDARYRLGVVGGYTQSWFNVDALSSSGSISSGFGGVYGGTALGAFRVGGGALFAYNSYDTTRNVAFPAFSETEKSNHGGDTEQVFGEVGYRFNVGPGVIEPFGGIVAMHIGTDSFSETGGAAALSESAHSYNYETTTLGVRNETPLFASTQVVLKTMIGWRHVFGDVTPDADLAFVGEPTTQFTVAGAPIARDSAAVEAGLDWKISPTTALGVAYQGDIASRTYDNVFKGKFEVAF